MATDKGGAVGRQLRTIFNVGAIRELTDGQLLERFATGPGEGAELAFAALVERHGAMVLRVARGVLDDPHDAQDAFQATFLVLVSRARGLWVRESLGPWLHQVAYRTASCLRAALARRRRLERKAGPVEETWPPEPVDDRARVLLEEVDRLPERYRAPVVLCDLEGRTHEQAARALGWPVGTVKSRQARARERLRDQLTRRGVAPGMAPMACWPAAEAALSATLVDRTTVAAVRHLASRAIAPGTAAALAREVIRPMIIARWTKLAAGLLALGAAATGTGLVAQDRARKPGDAPPAAEKPQVPEEKPAAAPLADPSVFEVKPGKIRFTWSERGSIEPAQSKDVICEVEGGTTIIMIKPEGTPVKKGEIVAELDSASLRDTLTNQAITAQQAEAAFKQAMLSREVAEYAIKEYVEASLPQLRATLQGKITLARSDIERGKDYQAQFQATRQRMAVAVANRRGPETLPDIAAEFALEDRREAAQLSFQRAQFELESALSEQKQLETYTAQKTTKGLYVDVERAKAYELAQRSRWELEKTKIRKLERQITACVLHAPGDGVVVYANANPTTPGRNAVQIEEGASVRERQKIFSIIDLAGPMRVIAKVQESMVDKVKPGQPVRVYVNAMADRTLEGVVASVAPFPDPNSLFADNKKVYTTFIALKDNGDGKLRPGLSAQAEILLDELDGVLRVPLTCLSDSRDGDHAYVAVKSPDGVKAWREVTLGRLGDQVAEVKEGLKPGDLVAHNPDGLDMTGKFRRIGGFQ